MAEFIQKNQSNAELKIYHPHQIAEWFEDEKSVSEDATEAFKLIAKIISVPKVAREEAL